MSSPFSTLSEELLDRVISFLSDYSFLRSLTLCNRQLNRLASSHLYRKVHFQNVSSDTGIKHLLPFTFHILQNPHLCSFVHEFAIRDMYGVEECIPPGYRDEETGEVLRLPWPEHPDLDTVLENAATKVVSDPGERADFLSQVRDAETEEPIIRLLLANLPNLRVLDLPVDDASENIVELLRGLAQDEPSSTTSNLDIPFRMLGTLMLDGAGGKYPNSPDILFFGLSLPYLRHLYGFSFGTDESADGQETSSASEVGQPSSSSVELLELRYSKLLSGDFTAIMRRFKGLRTLIYEVGNSWAWIDFDSRKLAEALQLQAHSIERLCVSHDDFQPWLDREYLAPISFKSFSKLRHLRVAPLWIFGEKVALAPVDLTPKTGLTEDEVQEHFVNNAFPDTLETLHFVRCDAVNPPYLTSALTMLLLKRPKSLPLLTRITLQGCLGGTDPQRADALWDQLATVRAEARDRGIEFVLIHEVPWRPERQIADAASNSMERGWGWDEDIEWGPVLDNMRPDRRSKAESA